MQERVRRITEVLSSEYGSPSLGNESDPVAEIVFILLSEKTDEAKYVQAYETLRGRFHRWDDVRKARQSAVAAAIKSAGMGKRRAGLIQRALRAIVDEFGGYDLSELGQATAAMAERRLLSVPGLGRKAVSCVLLYCFGKRVLPVDIHTYRLAIRLGIISRRLSYEQSHDALQLAIPNGSRRRFHVNAVAHGRERCKATNPRCDGCALRRFCSVPKSKREHRINVRPRPLVVELFSGGGGMSLGFQQAGFEIVQAIEKDKHAAATFKLNHRTADVIIDDISNQRPRLCAQRLALRPGDLAALIGGPPCQGFSESNRRTRSLENPRNHLYKQFFRYVRDLQPAWFVLENVAGLRTLADSKILDAILDSAKSIGYQANWKELNAVEYGVPQVRRRMFVVGNRVGAPILFPDPTHGEGLLPLVTVRDAIKDLPLLRVGADADELPYRTNSEFSPYQKLMRNGKKRVSGNLVTRNAAIIVDRYRHIKPGENWEAIPPELMTNYEDSSRCHTGIYYRLQWNEPSKVIGNFRKNMLIHPSQNRGLSVREAARLQSFPDEHIFVGSIGFQQQQVADAVPPLLAQAVAESVLKADRAWTRTHRKV